VVMCGADRTANHHTAGAATQNGELESTKWRTSEFE
jgi:hypothetical protein